jgi:hypothetical protein
MQAVIHPRFTKISSSATQNKGTQSKSATPATNEKKTGRRFLDFLRATLSASAI